MNTRKLVHWVSKKTLNPTVSFAAGKKVVWCDVTVNCCYRDTDLDYPEHGGLAYLDH